VPITDVTEDSYDKRRGTYCQFYCFSVTLPGRMRKCQNHVPCVVTNVFSVRLCYYVTVIVDLICCPTLLKLISYFC